MRTRSIPFWISAFIHLTVFGAAAVLFVKPPIFAMDTGHNSVEVSLVAADPDPVTPPPPAPVEPQEPIDPNPPKPDDMVVPAAPPTPPTPVPPPELPKVETPPAPVPPKPHHKATVAKGDGSAPTPGKDATTASSEGGAIMDAKPDYLSNPPPVYPEAARQAKEAGLVILEVIINTEGRPDSVSVNASSGFPPLDNSAVTAVRKWRFRPAEFGSMKVKSRVVIPVRFRLEE